MPRGQGGKLDDGERERVHGLLQRFGWNAVSFQVLEPGFRYLLDGASCTAFVDAGGTRVAAGPPIAEDGGIAAAAARFIESGHAEGRRVCFFGTEERFGLLTGMPQLCVGEQPVWDPVEWPATVASSRSLREQLRRARAKGLVVREVPAAELAEGAALRGRVEALVGRWLATRRMAPMGFLVAVELFSFAGARRYFAAERDGELVALLAAVPVYARGGWLIEDLLRDAGSPNGTAELLVDAAMRAFAAQGSRYATLGLAPLSGEVHGLFRWMRTLGAMLYDFDGVRAFKARLRPTRWDPIFLAAPRGDWAFVIPDVLRAFAGGGFFRFGLQTALRGPPAIVRLLAALLVPWTAGLLSVDAARFFPAPWVRGAWIAFDLALCGALFALGRRWRDWLGWLLAAAITADAGVTLAEVLLFNLPRMRTLPELIITAIGVLAPALASAVLWGALRARLKS